MPEQRREVGRASVESDGHVYTLLVYHQTFDEWDDPEGKIEERFIALGPNRRAPEPEEVAGWLGMLPGDFDGIGRTVHDGGGQARRHMAALEQQDREREAEKAALRARVTEETPRVERLEHGDCGYIGERHEFEERAYECSRCGSVGIGEDGRRCDQCHIFRAKAADLSCPSCEQPIDSVEELSVVVGVEVDGRFLPDVVA